MMPSFLTDDIGQVDRREGSHYTMGKTGALIAWLSISLAPLSLTAEGVEGGRRAQEQKRLSDEAQEASDLLSRAMEKYRSLNSYQGTYELGWERSQRGRTNEQVNRFGSIKFQRPNLIALESDEFSVFCNGTSLWIYRPRTHEYMEQPAPETIDLEVVVDSVPHVRIPPVAWILTKPDIDLERLYHGVKRITGLKKETLHGRPGVRVKGLMKYKDPRFKEPAPFSIWIGKRSGFFEEVRRDVGQGYADFRPLKEGEEETEGGVDWVRKFDSFYRFGEIRVNERIPESSFVFRSNSRARKVEAFETGKDWENLTSLERIGKVAPDFSATTVDAKKISLSDLKGRVVVLYSWWMRSGAWSLFDIQDLADEFKEENVTFLGINLSVDKEDTKMRDYLEKKGIRFPHVVDHGRGITEKLSGSSSGLILIDAEGIVQRTDSSYTDEVGEALKADIAKLLKGEQAFDPADIAKRIGRQKERQASYEKATKAIEKSRKKEQDGDEEIFPDDLVEVWSVRGCDFRILDIDGDGKMEFINRDMQGNLAISRGDPQDPEWVRFPSTGRLGVLEYVPVSVEKETWWFATVRSRRPGHLLKTTIGLYDASGKPAWTFTPEAGDYFRYEIRFTTGDLDGDGSDELLAFISRRKNQRNPHGGISDSRERADIVVFDRGGNRIAERRVGKRISYVGVLPASTAGQRPLIVCIADRRLKRFRFEISDF